MNLINKHSNGLRLALLAIFVLGSQFVFSANRYWVGSSSSNWNNTNNWSASSGGASGASVPGAADLVIFDGAGGLNGNCDVDANVNVLGFQISGYSGTISQNGFTMTFGNSGFSQSTGTFTGGSAAITISGTGIFSLSGGSFTSTTANFTINGTRNANQTLFTHSAGTFDHNNGSFVANPASGCSQFTYTFDVIGTTAFYNFTFQGSTGCTPVILATASSDVLDVVNNLNHNDGIFNADATVKGALSVGNGADGGYGTITINGTGNQTFSQTGTARTAQIVVNKTSGTLTPASNPMNFYCQSFQLQMGDFTAPTGNFNIGGLWNANTTIFTLSGGTFNANGGTVVFNPSSGCTKYTYTIDVPNTYTFNNVIIQSTTGCTPTVVATGVGNILNISGDLTHTDGVLDIQAKLQGNLILNAGADGGNGTITIDGIGNQTFSQTGTSRTGRISVNKSSGTFTPASSPMDFYCQSFELTNGSFTAPSGNFNIGGVWNANATIFTHSGGTFNANGGTVVLNPSSSCTQYTYTVDIINATIFNNVTVQSTTGCTPTIVTTAIGDVLNIAGDLTHSDGIINVDATVQGNLILTAGADGGYGTITLNGAGNQTYSQTGTSRTGQIIVNKPSGSLTPASSPMDFFCQSFSLVAGSFTAPTGKFSIGGLWNSNLTIFSHSGGTFLNNNGTVVIDPATSCTQYTYTMDVIGITEFFNLEIKGTTGCSSPIITTAAGDVVKVLNNLTHTDGVLNGLFEFKGNLSIASTSDGGTGTITANGTGFQQYTYTSGAARTCQLVVEKISGVLSPSVGTTDLSCQSFTLINGKFIAPTGDFNIGGVWNQNQVIFNHIGGVFDHNTGTVIINPSTPCTQRTYTLDVLSSTWFYNMEIKATTGCSSPIVTTGAGDIIKIANDFTHTDGIINGAFTFWGNLNIGANSDGGVGTITANGTGNQTYSQSGGAPRTVQVIVDKPTGTFTPALGTTTFSVQSFTLNSGIFTAPSGILNTGGTWNSNKTIFTHSGGTFNHNNGTVIFNPSSPCPAFTFSIDVLSATSFYNVELNGTTGCTNPTFTMAAGDTLDVTNNLTYTNGICNALIEVGGNVTVSGTFDGGNGKLIFKGNNAQTFDLSGATALFNASIDINKSANDVTLLSTCTLDAGAAQNIQFISGKLNTSSSNLLRVERLVGILGGNSSSYVNGPMVRMIANNGANNNIYFPIGAAGQFRQIYLNVSHTAATNYDYTAEVKTASATSLGLTLPGGIDKVSPVRYWQIDRSASGNLSAATVQAFYGSDDGVTDFNNLRLVKGNGGAWVDQGGIGTSNGSGSITSTINFTSFSPFALANVTGGTNFPGAALNFVGGNDYVSIASGGGLNNLQSGTIEMWVKWSGTQDAGYSSSSYGAVMARQSNSVFTNQLIALNGSNPATARIIWNPYSYNGTAITSTAAPGDGVWNHIAITYSSGDHKMYINGVLVGSSTATGTIANNSAKALTLGGWIDDGQGFSTSTMDEVRIWNRVLCQNEILNNMNCEIPTTANGLLANYHFNQGIGEGNNAGITSLDDATGNGWTGTLTNMALTGTTSNWVTNGAVASGLSCGVYGPEINVTGNSVSIADGDVSPSATDHTDFGSVNINSPFSRTFTVENLGISPLTVSSISTSGGDAAMFAPGSLVPSTPISPGSSATITVVFTPTSSGAKSTTLNINSDDCDEAIYNFSLAGDGVIPAAALNFDGSNDAITISNAASVQINSGTIEAWIKTSNAGSSWRGIVSKRQAYGLYLYNNELVAYDWTTASNINTGVFLNDGAWHHVAMAFDDGIINGTKIYVDGSLVTTLTYNISAQSEGLSIGCGNGVGTVQQFNGEIDEVRVWNKLLCKEEINASKNCEISGPRNGLVANYHFNQGLASGTNTGINTLTDASGYSNDGTLISFALSGSTSNWVAPGAVTSGVSCVSFCDSTSPVAVNAGTYTSTNSYESPSSGFTHYCDCQGKLLLSLKLGSSGAVIPDNGVSLKINSTNSNFYAQSVGFVGNTFGYAAMDRTWNVSPTTQPSSVVPVRFYFNNGDISSLDSNLTSHGLPGVSTARDLSFWKVINGLKPAHSEVPTLAQGDVKVQLNSAVQSDTSWTLGNRGGGNYFAQFLVTGFSGGGGGAGPLGLTPLPVELLYISAKGINNEYIQVKWATAQEKNSAYFIVERSENGLIFQSIGRVEALGNSNAAFEYSFNDFTALPNRTYVYRIRMVDENGDWMNSEIVTASLSKLISGTISIYPNPADNQLNILWPEDTEYANLNITGLDGRVIVQKTLNAEITNSFDVSNLTPGVYIVHIDSNGVVLNQKIVIQH